MSKMAQENQAINLSQGFPDFPVSDVLIDLIHQSMKAGHNQYAPMAGVPALRNVIARTIEETYHRSTNPETEITITAGGNSKDQRLNVVTYFVARSLYGVAARLQRSDIHGPDFISLIHNRLKLG